MVNFFIEMLNACSVQLQSVSNKLQLFAGLEYLAGKEVLHRDIKPQNLLVSGEGILKIADFGCSARSEGGRPDSGGTRVVFERNNQEIRMEDSFARTHSQYDVGTELYCAPEVVS